jgi:hypothetical protein
MAPCDLVEVDWCFRGAYCLHHWAVSSLPWWWRQYTLLKHWSTWTSLHGAISQKAVTFIPTAMRSWNLTLQGYFILSQTVSCTVICCVAVSLWILMHLSLLGLHLGGKYCFRRLNGLASGVMTVVKGCVLRPLQERWTQNNPDKDFCSSAFDFISFEPRYLNWFKNSFCSSCFTASWITCFCCAFFLNFCLYVCIYPFFKQRAIYFAAVIFIFCVLVHIISLFCSTYLKTFSVYV